MAIRFQCPACSEPIEVDEEWSRQVVRCPYCQRTVTAPAESTLPANEQIPVATPIAGRREFHVPADSVGPAGAVPPYPPQPQTNRAAAVALTLAITSVVLLLLCMQTLTNHTLEMQKYQEFLKEAIATGASPTTAVLKYHESQGGQWPGWLVTMSILAIGSLGAWLGAIVFGIIGLFRTVRRGMAVAALSIAGLLTMYFCLSALVGGAG
jgi:hypothetical protein